MTPHAYTWAVIAALTLLTAWLVWANAKRGER